MACEHPDPAAIGGTGCGRAEDLLNGCLRDRDVLPAEQSIDVRFADFMADEDATLDAIYELAGQPYDRGARTAMAAFIAATPARPARRGALRHGDLGLDTEDVARRLRAYRDRFITA